MMRSLVSALVVFLVVASTTTTTTTVMGQSYSKYMFAVLSDTHIGASNATWLLNSAVQKINSLVSTYNIKFVFITGDVTNSAMGYQWAEARKLLDQLTIPYYPIIGNHDQWPYNSTWENNAPTGDQLFYQTFSDKFTDLVHNNQTVYNPTNKVNSFFQNFEMQVENIMFYGLDFNSRHHAVSQLGYKGSMPGADLFNFPGGTYQWLDSRLAALAQSPPPNLRIVIMHHQPYRAPFPVPEEIYAWSTVDKDQLKVLYSKYFPIPTYWGLLAGHFHMWENQTAFDEPAWKTFWMWETDACKTDSSFALVPVVDGDIDTANMMQMYGDKP